MRFRRRRQLRVIPQPNAVGHQHRLRTAVQCAQCRSISCRDAGDGVRTGAHSALKALQARQLYARVSGCQPVRRIARRDQCSALLQQRFSVVRIINNAYHRMALLVGAQHWHVAAQLKPFHLDNRKVSCCEQRLQLVRILARAQAQRQVRLRREGKCGQARSYAALRLWHKHDALARGQQLRGCRGCSARKRKQRDAVARCEAGDDSPVAQRAALHRRKRQPGCEQQQLSHAAPHDRRAAFPGSSAPRKKWRRVPGRRPALASAVRCR